MDIKIYIIKLSLIILICSPVVATAQSMQVIGGQQSARNCYTAATMAAQMHIASDDEIEECTYALKNALLTRKDRVATLINRGIIFVALEEYDQAIEDYDDAFKLSPNVAEIHVNRGNMFFMTRIFERAIAEYTLALEMDFSKEHIALYNRGLTYEKMGDYEKAEADYRRALEILPGWNQAERKLNRILNRTEKG